VKEILSNAFDEQLLHELAQQVLGAVVRRYRDFAMAEDAVQEAMLAAFTQWPKQGVPENPRGWLIQVASRRMTDQARNEIARRERETSLARNTETTALAVEIELAMDMDPNDALILLFICCHPALTSSSAIALTLRAVGGLTTA
jgi:predicted RNA polymerase sigma factor